MLNIGNATQLVICFGIGEVIFKFFLPGGIGGKGKARLPFSGSIELDQFAGHVFGSFSCLGFGFLPCIGTDFV